MAVKRSLHVLLYVRYVMRNHFSIVLKSQKAVDVGKNEF